MPSKSSVPQSSTEIVVQPVTFAERAPNGQPSTGLFEPRVSSPVLRSTSDRSARGNHAITLPHHACPSGRHVRKGKIARLPKLYRDMVNRLLQNNIPCSKIVAALDGEGILVTERNLSNWRTRGGYKEWCLEQERQLQLSMIQDNLTDYLRKNDAGQLPEVGLQVAATQLSSMLLQPDAVQQLTAEPEKYSKVVDMLCRLSTHIQSLQKDRNEAVNRAAIRGTSEEMRRHDEEAIEKVRWESSAKMAKKPTESNVPHRNELPKRDRQYFRELPSIRPSFYEIDHAMKIKLGLLPPLPTPQPEATKP